ncbi:MAG: peptidyl-prolyl cis-trans isomerase [Desulfuromonadaceae bacterium]|nr:peptidyl-prolyl cis-trans isomerase [Desulfuromonadaceae bacterium]
MSNKNRMVLSGAVVALLLATSLSAEPISKIAAVVNDEMITTRQLQQQLEKQPAGAPMSAQMMLEKMIAELLIRQRAEEIGLEVSEEDIDQAVGDVEQQNGIERDQLEEALIAQGLTMEIYRNQLRDQILRYKLTGIEVKSKADVTKQEVRNYYQEHLDEYRQKPRMRLSRVSFPLTGDAEQVRKAAEQARRDLLAGRSIDEVIAAQPPQTAADGGDMGSFSPGELTPQFDLAVADLQTGEVSAIVEKSGVLHLLKMEERIPGRVADLPEVEAAILDKLRRQRMDEKLQQWSEELKAKAYIDRRL